MNKKIVWGVLVVIFLISGAGVVWRSQTLEYVSKLKQAEQDLTMSQAQIDELERQTAVKVAALKSSVLKDLKVCETRDLTENDAPILLDSNNEMSIGELMFQIKTVQFYEQKLYAKKVTRKEAVLIALDHDQAFKLAEDIIFTDSKGIENWHNCNKLHSLAAQVELIKKVQ